MPIVNVVWIQGEPPPDFAVSSIRAHVAFGHRVWGFKVPTNCPVGVHAVAECGPQMTQTAARK